MTNSERTPLELASAASAGADERAPSVDWDAWFTPWRFAVVLLLLLLAAFPEVWTGTHTFFYRDFGCFGYPLAHYHREAFWRGEIPLWNPLNNCGLPYLAQWNTMVFYPLSVVYLLGPMPWAPAFFTLGHLFLAGLGMYFLAYRWTGHRFAASVAGMAWALNGLTLHALMWTNNIAALAWMPFVILLASRAVREGGLTILSAALVGGVQVLAGAPEVILFTWLLVGALTLVEKGVTLRQWVPRLAAVGLIVVGLTAVQMLPFLDLMQHSQRDQHYTTQVWPMPAWGLLNFIMPLFRCTPSLTGGVYSQDQQQWTSSYYAGIAVLVLAVIALWRLRERRVWMLGAIVVCSLLLAVGDATPVYTVCRKFVPGFNAIRFPIKFVIPALLAFPLLAALAVAYWQRLPATQLASERRRWLMIAGAFAVPGVWAGVVAGFIGDKGSEDAALTVPMTNALIRVAFLALAVGTILFLRRASGTTGLLCRFGILLVIGLDALTHAPRQNPAVPVEAYASNLPLHEWSASDDGSRAMMHPRTKAVLDYAANRDLLLFCLGQRRALVPNWNLLENLPSVDGFYSLYTREQKQVFDLFYASTNYPAGLANFLGVAHTSAAPARELFGWEDRPGALPIVQAGQQVTFLSEAETLRALADPKFDAARVVCLPEAAKWSTLANAQGTPARVVSTKAGAGTRRVEVEADAPTVLTVAQTHYHWWQAKVNGQPTPLWPANHAFQALALPAGRSVVELSYRDHSFHAGAAISLATLCGCGVWWGLGRRRSRRHDRVASGEGERLAA